MKSELQEYGAEIDFHAVLRVGDLFRFKYKSPQSIFMKVNRVLSNGNSVKESVCITGGDVYIEGQIYPVPNNTMVQRIIPITSLQYRVDN